MLFSGLLVADHLDRRSTTCTPSGPTPCETLSGGLDVVLDGVGGAVAEAAFGLLERDGTMISFGFSSGTGWPDVPDEIAAERGIRVQRAVFGPAEELTRRTAEAFALAAAGHLRPVIGQRFPLDRAADAQHAMETRAAVGKTLLTT